MKILSNLKASALTGLKANALNDSRTDNTLGNSRADGLKKTKGSLANLKLKGFTLAEVLITLTIIGVVAALTIPALLSNVTDKTYEQKRKGLQTRLAQAVSQMDSLNSYIDTDDPVANSSMKFINEGLSKVYKITNVCEFDNFAACDFPETMSVWWQPMQLYTKNIRHIVAHWGDVLTDEDLGGPQADAAAFKTKNGESFLLWYNPYCIAEQEVAEGGSKKFAREICAAFKVDLDGTKKGPNIIGRDIVYGIILYPDTPYTIVMNPHFVAQCGGKASYDAAGNNSELCCNNVNQEGSVKGSLTLPTKEQAYIINVFHHKQDTWTSSVTGSTGDDYGWIVNGLYTKYVKRTTIANAQSCVRKESTK